MLQAYNYNEEHMVFSPDNETGETFTPLGSSMSSTTSHTFRGYFRLYLTENLM